MKKELVYRVKSRPSLMLHLMQIIKESILGGFGHDDDKPTHAYFSLWHRFRF